ncbi:MAG: hydroxyacid dehydrogenase [Anaerolineaceae bacterium]|jgi:Ni,Fe-hydrogenase III large subunit|nr:hydroxyacid dehydrogenase [Anaerolineaceae bacterium]
MPYKIPLGPIHPAFEEPYKLTLSCTGEVVDDAQVEVGFVMRSIELLAQRRNYTRDIVLVEHVCGICSNVHASTFAMTVEKIAQLEVPARARYIRTIIGELERLHSHLLWAGIGSEDIGYHSMFMEIYYLRERVMDILEAISGNRVNYGMMTLGGVTRDIADPKSVLEMVKDVRAGIEKAVIPIFTQDATIIARTKGIGILTKEDAITFGTVGPLARASGIAEDIRESSPYAAYQELGFKKVVLDTCDVQARVVVRALEMLESLRLIEEALKNLPGGPIVASDVPLMIPAGEATARSEAPRGEVFYYVSSDGSDVPARVKIRTPSFVNIPSVRAMVKGQFLADMPLIQASIDPCCSCTDR